MYHRDHHLQTLKSKQRQLPGSVFVRLLAVMGQPFAVSQFHVSKDCPERGILRGAGINAEADLFAALPHVADAHLGEGVAVNGAFNAVIVFRRLKRYHMDSIFASMPVVAQSE